IYEVRFIGKHQWILLGLIVDDNQWGNRNSQSGFYFDFSFVISFVMSMTVLIAMPFVVDYTAGHKNGR
ncbi:MAG: hypothetical protein OEY26_05555, partial [Nitrospinota bacterium]|nr:hypothetical protein [Nitrospinota bacterium]